MEFEYPDTTIARRKSEHLRLVAEKDVVHSQGTALGDVVLFPEALPELDFADIRTDISFFGKTLAAPLMITSMTGGADYAGKLNRALASAAWRHNIAFAVGSQRVMIRHPEVTQDFAVRRFIPDGVLLGNIGAVQLAEYPPKVIRKLIDDIDADGVCVHLNVAQELLQKEGHRRFKGIADQIGRLVDQLEGRVVVKETGAGLSPQCLRKLCSLGVKYIDVSGAGGTSWTKVEMHRAEDELLKRSGQTFADWGLPTAFCVVAARKICGSQITVIGSGGIKNGLDVARAIALGADMVGFARPALLAFLNGGEDGVGRLIDIIKNELRMAMLLTGAGDLKQLRKIPRLYTGRLRELLDAGGLINKAKK